MLRHVSLSLFTSVSSILATVLSSSIRTCNEHVFFVLPSFVVLSEKTTAREREKEFEFKIPRSFVYERLKLHEVMTDSLFHSHSLSFSVALLTKKHTRSASLYENIQGR